MTAVCLLCVTEIIQNNIHVIYMYFIHKIHFMHEELYLTNCQYNMAVVCVLCVTEIIHNNNNYCCQLNALLTAFYFFFGSKQRSSSLTALFKAVCLYVRRLIAL